MELLKLLLDAMRLESVTCGRDKPLETRGKNLYFMGKELDIMRKELDKAANTKNDESQKDTQGLRKEWEILMKAVEKNLEEYERLKLGDKRATADVNKRSEAAARQAVEAFFERVKKARKTTEIP
ncbi:hypothetical protein HDV64DRAFT_264297 [Trichoderma sp. TUCIM 5745]